MYRLSPKLILIIASGHPTSVPNFSRIGVQLQKFFQVSEKMKKKLESMLTHISGGNALCYFLQIWCVVSLNRRAPPQQLWCSSDKRSWSFQCVKIMTLVFLLIYSHGLSSWATRHTTVCLDATYYKRGFHYMLHPSSCWFKFITVHMSSMLSRYLTCLLLWRVASRKHSGQL